MRENCFRRRRSIRSICATSTVSRRPSAPSKSPARAGTTSCSSVHLARGRRCSLSAFPRSSRQCRYFGDPTRECHCTPPMIQRYVSKISGPLLDRIDIRTEVPAVKDKELGAPSAAEEPIAVRRRVLEARQRQLERFKGDKKIYANAQMMPKLIRKYCAIAADG